MPLPSAPRNCPAGAGAKSPPASAGDTGDPGSTPGSERCPGVENGNPLQCSCPECRGQRSLAGYGQQRAGHDWAHTHTHTHTHRSRGPPSAAPSPEAPWPGQDGDDTPEDELAHMGPKRSAVSSQREAALPWFGVVCCGLLVCSFCQRRSGYFKGNHLGLWEREKKKKQLFCLKGASHQLDPDHRCPRKEAEPWWRDYPMDGDRNLPPSIYVLWLT